MDKALFAAEVDAKNAAFRLTEIKAVLQKVEGDVAHATANYNDKHKRLMATRVAAGKPAIRDEGC